MSDYYRFNIARQSGTKFDNKPRYLHYFAGNLEASNFRHEMELKSFADDLRKRFPAPEFKVDVTLWQYRGYTKAEY